jgi:helix-turn-helix protein
VSREARQWAWDYVAIDDPRSLLILLSIADVADEWGWGAYPSIRRLSKDSRGHDRTVQRHLTELVRREILEVTAPSSGQRPTTYRIVPLDPDRLHDPQSRGDKLSPLPSTRPGSPPADPRQRGDRGVTSGESAPLIGTGRGRESRVSDSATRLCGLFADLLGARDGAVRPTVTAAWLADMDKLMRLDHREETAIERTLRWLDKGADDISLFWKPLIRSPKKLREKWDMVHDQYEAHKIRAANVNGRTARETYRDREEQLFNATV